MIQYVCDICNKSKCSSNEGDELYLMTAMVKGKTNIWDNGHICISCIRAAICALPGPEKKSESTWDIAVEASEEMARYRHELEDKENEQKN